MAQGLLLELHQRGIRLRLVDGRLDVLAPAGALTPELRERLRTERDQLIALLGAAEAGDDLPEITPRPQDRYEPFPLTDIQHAYWVGRSVAVELGGVSTHYYFELDGQDLDPVRLEDSLNTVIAHHDMLRAVVQADGRQRVLPEVARYRIPVHDLRSVDEADRTRVLERVRADMGHTTPPPDRWPLFDIRFSLLDGRRTRLHLSFNILIVDFFSLSLLFRDWRRAYENPDWRPEPLPLSYRDYVLTQRAQQDGARYRRAEGYWLDRIDQLPPAPDLPLARQPSQLSTVEFVRRQGRLPRERWEAVKRIARRRALTPSVVLMTAFADVLRAWSSRQSSFTLNLTLFERPPLHPNIEDLIGDFTTLTMLAVPPAVDEPFALRAEQLNGQLMRDLEHIAYSGVRVLRERARALGSGLGASMPVVFTSGVGATTGRDPADDRGMFGRLGFGISQTPQVYLDHQVMEEQGDLLYSWDAVDALFPAGMLDDMFGAYTSLLDRLSTDEAAWDEKGGLVVLPDWQVADRETANDTGHHLPAATLCGLVEQQAERRPDAVAVVADRQRRTYREIVEDGYRLARRLVDRGARPGTLVAVVLDKGWEQVAATFGVTRSGAAYLPVDPHWPQARRDQLLDLGGVRLAVTTPRLRDGLSWPAGVEVVTLDDAEVRAAEPTPPDTAPAPEDLAYVIFTSGSTGQPKGVMIDHRGAANTIQDINQRFGVGPDDAVLALSALSFDLSVYDVFGTLAAGGTTVMPSPSGVHDPDHWTDLMREHGVSVWNSVPALLQAWVDSRVGRGEVAPPGLRLALLSGDWIPVALPDALRAHYPDAAVISLGGATEASIWSVHYPIGVVPPDWTRIPYGKPLANQTLHVYDERMAPCPVWTSGELYIGGVGVAKGYWADPDRTAERFVIHPTTGERLYRTGDLGRYLPGGDIEFLGREDFQVKINGYRIELGEIIATLRRQPGVGEALVRVDTNPTTGRRQLVAYIVASGPASSGLTSEVSGPAASGLRSEATREDGASQAPTPAPAEAGARVNPATLREQLENLLPGYLVPHHYLLIDRVPLSANGKVDLSALPSPWDDAATGDLVAPRDDLERVLFDIWSDALERDDFGVTDNFFELGADSLHAVRILGRLRDDLGFDSEGDEGLQALFESPTIAELAVTLREKLGG